MQQERIPVPAGLTVERAAWVIRDLPEDIPQQSAARIVTGTLAVAGVEVEELSQSCEARETELQAEIGQSLQTVSELESGTEEAIRSLQEQITRAREDRDAQVRQEQENIEQARSEISDLQILRDFFAAPESEEQYEFPDLEPSDTDEGRPPASLEETAEGAADQAEPPPGEATPAEKAARPLRTTYGLLFLAMLLPVLLSVGALSYFVLQPETSTGSNPDDPPSGEGPEEPPSREESAGKPAGSDRTTEEDWDLLFARNPLPGLATPREGASMDYDGRIALTFDDGPDPRTTPAILDVLGEHDLQATFFVSGEQVEQNPALVRRMVREGHTLGNHTHSHRDMSGLPPAQMRRELQSTEQAVDRALGRDYEMRLMRPPFGEPYSSQSSLSPFRGVMKRMGVIPVLWTVDSRDWELGDQSSSIVGNVARRTDESGGVLLLHDNNEGTPEALPRIIARYEREGLAFNSVSDMLDDKYGAEPEEQSAAPSWRL